MSLRDVPGATGVGGHASRFPAHQLSFERLFGLVFPPVLIDEPVSAEITATGRPAQITGLHGCYRVRRVLAEWQAPGEARYYRLQVATPDGLAIAEVVAHAEATGWRLRRFWT